MAEITRQGKSMATVTTDDLLDALKEVIECQGGDPGAGVTITEIADSTGLHRRDLREMIRRAMSRGEVEVCRVPREGIDGVTRQVPGYRVANAA